MLLSAATLCLCVFLWVVLEISLVQDKESKFGDKYSTKEVINLSYIPPLVSLIFFILWIKSLVVITLEKVGRDYEE